MANQSNSMRLFSVVFLVALFVPLVSLAAPTKTPQKVEVTNFPAVQAVTGAVEVTNLPDVQDVNIVDGAANWRD